MIGLLARYGSERIRGHGIPEAIEAILINGSRVEPKVAILKPLSSAISIGSGGPFGAEGPIIMTGGAFGSMVAQLFRLTAAERKTLLVAGAAGGMSATFASPVAAVLLAVELLLFEWKPRSLIPVALASAAAEVMRVQLMGPGRCSPRRRIPRSSISRAGRIREAAAGGDRRLAEAVESNPVVAYPDEPLRVVVYRMVETGLTQFPVVARGTPSKLLGLIALDDLLLARRKSLEEERRRERVLQLRPFSAGRAAPDADQGVADRSG